MPFTDNFTGNANDLISGRTGWTAVGSGTDDAKINASNQAKFTNTTFSSKLVYHNATVTDHYAQCTARSAFVGQYFPLTVRTLDDLNYWGFRIVTNGTGEVWSCVAGTYTALNASIAITVADGDTIRLDATGDTISVLQNGTSRFSGSMSGTHSTRTFTGMHPRSNATGDPIMDDWESTDPTIASAQPAYQPWAQRGPILAQ